MRDDDDAAQLPSAALPSATFASVSSAAAADTAFSANASGASGSALSLVTAAACRRHVGLVVVGLTKSHVRESLAARRAHRVVGRHVGGCGGNEYGLGADADRDQHLVVRSASNE